MPTFADAVLYQPEVASIVFGFQFGVYEDVRSCFYDFNHLVDFYASDGLYSNLYVLDPAFQTSLRLRDKSTPPNALVADDLCLLQSYYRDDRFPLHLAIAEGDLYATKRILRCRPDLAFKEVILVAITYGHLDIVTYLFDAWDSLGMGGLAYNYEDYVDHPTPHLPWRHMLQLNSVLHVHSTLRLLWEKRQCNWRQKVLRLAVKKATSQDVVPFLYERMPDAIYAGFMDDAASMGLLAIVKDLHRRDEACTTDAMDQAAANGHLDVVQFLHAHRTEGGSPNAMILSMTNGHLDVVRFLIEQCHQVAPPDALDMAAAYGHLELLTYLDGLGTLEASNTAVDMAATNGHLDVVRYLVAHGSDGGSRASLVQSAIAFGRNEVALYLASERYALPTDDVYLRCCLDKPNALAIVQLLLDNNVPFSSKMLDDVRSCASDDVLRLVETRVPGVPWTIETVQSALCKQRIDRLAPVFAHQPELRRNAWLELVACSTLHVPSLECLLEAGIGSPRDVILKCGRHVEVLEVLLPHCLDHDNPIDNLVFLVEWYVSKSLSLTKSTLLLLKTEMVRQATAANVLVINTSACAEIAALAATLLERGATTSRFIKGHNRSIERSLDKSAVADWGLATLFVHFWSTNATKYATQLGKWVQQTEHSDLKMRLQRLFNTTFPSQDDSK